MSFYERLYYRLCREKSQLKEMYGYGSGLHRHRIVPGHIGGEYTEDNITYLTVREHIIAHYLLWKIYRSPDDLRSMKMLGANLSHEQRVIVGKWCHENKIGFHKFVDTEEAKIWRQRGLDTQKRNYEETGSRDSFYYWATDEGFRVRASMGGKASWEYQKTHRNGLPFCLSLDPEERKKNASKAANHSGKFPVTDGTVCKKLKTEEDRQKFLIENPSFRSGGRPYTRRGGSRWMNKSGESKNVSPDKVESFIADGWSFGRK